VYVHVYACMRVCVIVCACVPVCLYLCEHVCVCLSVGGDGWVWILECVVKAKNLLNLLAVGHLPRRRRRRTKTRARAHTHTHTHTHIHTHTHTRHTGIRTRCQLQDKHMPRV
jgi:hypothetical protein